MDFSIRFDTVKSGWSIVYIEGSQDIIPQKYILLSLKIDFATSNSVDPDEMLHSTGYFIGVFTICESTRLRVSCLQTLISF